MRRSKLDTKEMRKLRESGSTYNEIGELIGCAEETVRQHLNQDVREENRERVRRYNRNHREERRRYSREYYEKHRKEMDERSQEYRKNHLEECRAYDREYYKNHYQEEAKESSRKWVKNNPEKRRRILCKSEAKRRALKAKAAIGEREAIDAIYRRAKEDEGIRCYLCDKMIPVGERHVDHITPLSQDGEHRASNLAVACAGCNMRKGSKLPEEIGILI